MFYEDPEAGPPYIGGIFDHMTPPQIEEARQYRAGWRDITEDGDSSKVIRNIVARPYGAPYTEAFLEVSNLLKSFEREIFRLRERVKELESSG